MICGSTNTKTSPSYSLITGFLSKDIFSERPVKKVKISNVELFVSIESRLDKVVSVRLSSFNPRQEVEFYFIILFLLTIFFQYFCNA